MHDLYKGLLACLCFAIPTLIMGQQGQIDHLRPDIVAAEQHAAARLLSVTSSPLTNDYDLKYHRLEWQVDPAIKYIHGAITSYFRPVVAGFDTLYFDLSDSLHVDSVHYHGQSATFAHLTGELLRITLPSVIAMGAIDSITVWYQGRPFGTGFGSFIQDVHNSTPIIWTLSEPFGAKDWWPCKSGITDKIDSMDAYVTAPVGNRVAGNGVLVSVTPGAGVNTHHWRHRHPIATYLIAFAVTNYVAYSNWVPYNGDTLEVLNYVFPEDSGSFAFLTPNIVSVIQLYDTLLGIYPYQDEKYGHAQFGWGGGMEHQTMSFVVSPDFELIAHELAHQWFGDKVTCGSWHDIWLNEGWATYCSGLTYEHGLGSLSWMDFKSQRIGQVISAPDGSVWVDDTTSVNRIFNGRLSYSKGAMVLHQLRWLIGDSAFFAATRNYMASPSLAYGFATTDDFVAEMEASSGRSLTSYFDDWFYGQGFPTYTVNWSQIADTATFEISQTASFPSSVPFFHLPVPIRITDGVQDTTVVLDNTFNGQIFKIRVRFPFNSIQVDPERWLITGPASVFVAADAPELEASMQVFPNPAQSFVNLRGRRFEQLHLYDLAGNQIFAQSLQPGAGTQRVDLPSLPAGMYLLRVKSGNRFLSEKLVLY